MSARLVPTPIGLGPGYHPPALSASVRARRPVGELRCEGAGLNRVGVHLELFGRGRVVIVPAGIGVAPPWRHLGLYRVSGGCSYSARTRDPTGVIEIAAAHRLTLGDFFDIWGQPLGRRRLAGFRARGKDTVRAFVDGSPWNRSARAIPLRRHAEIVLELGVYVPPHAGYRFGNGL
jgi:hypothetical protein